MSLTVAQSVSISVATAPDSNNLTESKVTDRRFCLGETGKKNSQVAAQKPRLNHIDLTPRGNLLRDKTLEGLASVTTASQLPPCLIVLVWFLACYVLA